MDTVDISRLDNPTLLARADMLAAEERERGCLMLETLAVIDERRAYRDLECRSLYEYCVFRLRYSEAAAYRRIRAIRAIRLFAPIAMLLRQGRLTLETTTLLHPYLESPDAAELVSQAAGLRTWQVARLIAARKGPPPQRDSVRFMGPMEAPAAESPSLLDLVDGGASAGSPQRDAPGAAVLQEGAGVRRDASGPPFTVRLAFTADERFWALLQRAKAVLRHKYPDGCLEGVLGDALDMLLKAKDRGRRVTLPSRPPRKMAE